MEIVSWGWIGLAAAAEASAVLALWLRLRWRVREEQARGETLVALAAALPAGGQVRDRRPDGSLCTLTVGTGRRDDAHRG